jgi:cysteine dioxygenase
MAPALAQDNLSSSGGFSTSFVSPKAENPFTQLVDDLARILGPTSGLTTEGVDVQMLTQLMEEYISKEADWEKYAFADLSRGYTRNLVDEGNGKSNLVHDTLFQMLHSIVS